MQRGVIVRHNNILRLPYGDVLEYGESGMGAEKFLMQYPYLLRWINECLSCHHKVRWKRYFQYGKWLYSGRFQDATEPFQ